MKKSQQRIIKELEDIVGKANVIYHPEDLLVYEYDGSIDKAIPEAVVFPATTEEVSKLVALAHREDIPVVGRGSGTGLSGGAIASLGGLQIALTRMRGILEIDVVNGLAVVEPGVVNLDLDYEAHKYGMRYAPDPSSQKACSLGGNIAENAGGPHCLAYGVTTNHVLGMEVVLEDGSVTWLGGKTREVPGYDLRGVFVGSEGTFGIATKIVVRLLPLPESVHTLLGAFADVDSACNAVSSIIGKGIVPAAIEMIDAACIKAILNVTKGVLPSDAGAVLLVEVEGIEEEVKELSGEVEATMYDAGAEDVRVALEDQERERLWAARKGAFGALGSLAPNYYLVDGVVPRTRLNETLRRVAEIGERYGLLVANVFHAGDGNLHPCIAFDEREPGATDRVIQAGEEMVKVCVEMGGTLSGEHGIGLEKKAYMPLIFTQEDMDVMVRVRNSFSPNVRFNPGKIFPGGPEYDQAMQRKAVSSAGPGVYI
ncbi:MAG: FAD-binding protein [Dehalococcoidia bacterium]|nr:FAD-binding protein [Dehalococcoidia bacterium]